jgi:hypothetical protein
LQGIFQPQVEPANNNGSEDNGIGELLSGPKRRCWGSRCTTPFSDRAKSKARRGIPAGLGYTPEEYLFVHESRFTVQKSQVAEVAGCTTSIDGDRRLP